MMNKTVVKYENWVQEILFLMITLVFCTPILANSDNKVLVCAFVGIYIIANLNVFIGRQNSSLFYPIVFFLCFVFGYRFIGVSDAAWGNYLNQLGFFFCILFTPFLSKGREHRQLFFWLIWIILVFNIVDNIILGYLYPSINYARLYVDEEFLESINAGGPSFYLLVLFVSIICFFSFLNCKRKSLRIPLLIVFVLGAIYILGFCYKGITVVFLLLSFFIIILAKCTKNKTTFLVISGGLILITIVLVWLFSDSLVGFIKKVSPNERLSIRLITLIDDSDMEADSFTVSGRTQLYLLSIKTWLSGLTNFLIGIGDHRVQFGAAKTGISQHSDLLDVFAIYGLVGFFLLYLIFKHAFKTVLSFFDSEYTLQVSSILLLFVLYGVVEKIFFPSTGFVIFMLLPLAAGLVNKNTID